MFDLIPENLDGVCVLNLKKAGPPCDPRYCDCGSFAVSVHNLMLQSNLRYVIVDLQDEKEICNAFVEEMLQLWKRVRVPFLFAGVMPRIEALLASYDYMSQSETYGSAEEAAQVLRRTHPALLDIRLEGIDWGKNLPVPRSRQAQSAEEEEESD